jgi:hypothetical protein
MLRCTCTFVGLVLFALAASAPVSDLAASADAASCVSKTAAYQLPRSPLCSEVDDVRDVPFSDEAEVVVEKGDEATPTELDDEYQRYLAEMATFLKTDHAKRQALLRELGVRATFFFGAVICLPSATAPGGFAGH